MGTILSNSFDSDMLIPENQSLNNPDVEVKKNLAGPTGIVP